MSYKVNIRVLSSFEDVLKALDGFGVGFIAIVDNNDQLLGIVTDGDIRKALLHGKQTVNEIINKSPLTLPFQTPVNEVEDFLVRIKRHHIPLVDENNTLKKVYILNDFNRLKKDNAIVIMAGGLGSRLGDLTKKIPKPMLEFKGKPILFYIIDSFKNQGFYRFILCVNYKSEVIENYFGNGERFNVEIDYVKEKDRLGTAGALSLIDNSKITQPFFVVNGDVISTINYNELLLEFNKLKADALMSVKNMSYINPYAAVAFDDSKNLVTLEEKPSFNFHVNLGIYVLNVDITSLIPHNSFFDMPELLMKAKSNGLNIKVTSVPYDWMDIGNMSDYEKVKNEP